MPISHRRQVIFIHIPKNAGTAITESCDHEFFDKGHHAIRYYRARYPDAWKKFFSFAIVRNPWDRCVSNYEYARMERSYWHSPDGTTQYPLHPDFQTLAGMDFDRCISLLTYSRAVLKHRGWMPQHVWICNWRGSIQVDKAFHYDSLDGDPHFASIVPHLSRINCSTRTGEHYRNYYNSKTRDQVYRLYKKDIRLFGFEF